MVRAWSLSGSAKLVAPAIRSSPMGRFRRFGHHLRAVACAHLGQVITERTALSE